MKDIKKVDPVDDIDPDKFVSYIQIFFVMTVSFKDIFWLGLFDLLIIL